MKRLFFIGSLFFTAILFSQNKGAIQGNIVDLEMNNEPLLFANVLLKDTSRSVQTNFHGNFEITDVDPGEHTLVISFLGYESMEVPVVVEENGVTEINSGLTSKTISLNQVALLDEASKK